MILDEKIHRKFVYEIWLNDKVFHVFCGFINPNIFAYNFVFAVEIFFDVFFKEYSLAIRKDLNVLFLFILHVFLLSNSISKIIIIL